ncbi:flagellar hook-length control protein FliK [Demequina subtropica]|uniref:flagellar hook-length control protein FliK n=1 Tax=Demequina subtropica TaxID=1638989 RepID=UPI000783FA3B|nr:flagellar hook-length control protein FliK [Demequina subtropica]
MTVAPTVPAPQPARASTSRASGAGSDGDAFARELAAASGGSRRDDAGDRSRVGSRRDEARPAGSGAARDESRADGAVASAAEPSASGEEQAATTEAPAAAPGMPVAATPAPATLEGLVVPVTPSTEVAAEEALPTPPGAEGAPTPATGVPAAVAAATLPAVVGRGAVPSPAPGAPAVPTDASGSQVATVLAAGTSGVPADAASADDALVPAVPAAPAAASSDAEAVAPEVLERVLAALRPAARDASAPQGEPAQPAPARGAEPVQGLTATAPTQTAAPTATVQAAAPVSYARDVPVASQLSAPLASLKQLPMGEHEMQIAVTPESFGHVRVVAKITPEGVSVQLFGSTEAGREALRAALSDLRRDLEDAGLGSDLDLGADGGASRDAGGQEQRTRGTAASDAWPGASATGVSTTDHPIPTRLDARAGGVDILL